MQLRLIAFAFLLAAPGCTQFALPEARSATNDHRALQTRLQLAVDQIVASQGLPGASAAAITEEGVELTAASGFADKEVDRRMQPGTPMLGASTGKTFVAALALALQSEAKLDLDDPISRRIAEVGDHFLADEKPVRTTEALPRTPQFNWRGLIDRHLPARAVCVSIHLSDHL